MAVVGCTAPNPSYEGGDPSTTAETHGGTEAGTSAATTTRPATATTTDEGPGETADESGASSCAEPPAGIPVEVRPMDVPPMDLCGYQEAGAGRLEFSGGQYLLHRNGCRPGESVPVVFSPKGPAFGDGEGACVDFDLRYRPDCTFEAVTIRDGVTDVLIFAAASVASSHVQELELELDFEMPVGDVCDCGSAACCEGAPAPGLYEVHATTSLGESRTLSQSGQTMFSQGPEEYELGMPRARVIDDCDAPVQVDWHYRRLPSSG